MMRFRGVAALLLAIVSALGFFAPAKAATGETQVTETGTAAGLIVKYVDGVSAQAADGLATGSNAAKTQLTIGQELGDGLVTADFTDETSISKAQGIAGPGCLYYGRRGRDRISHSGPAFA